MPVPVDNLKYLSFTISILVFASKMTIPYSLHIIECLRFFIKFMLDYALLSTLEFGER